MNLLAYKGSIVLVLVFLSSIWLLNQAKAPLLKVVKVAEYSKIDYFSKGYTKIEMNEQGIPVQRLDASSLQHESHNDEMQFNDPIVTVYQVENTIPPWVINAESGRMSANGQTIFLNDAVLISRAASKSAQLGAIKIKTRDLMLEPDKAYAETAAWAELTTNSEVISGIGLEFFYQQPLYIKLLKAVKGRRHVH